MKKIILPAVFVLVAGLSFAQESQAATRVMEGYVCTISRSSITGGRSSAGPTALAFNLTTEPECKGTRLEMNYACTPAPRSGQNIGFCAKDTTFSMAEQAMMHDELLHAAERNLPVDVVRQTCMNDHPTETCFVHFSIYNIPSAE